MSTGRNGSGKSTLMQVLDGTLSPTTGAAHSEPFVKVRSLMQHTVDNLRDNAHKDLTPVQLLAHLARQVSPIFFLYSKESRSNSNNVEMKFD